MKIAYPAKSLLGLSGIETYKRELVHAIAKNFPDITCSLVTSINRKERFEKYFSDAKNIEILNQQPHDLMLGPLGRPLVRAYDHLYYKFRAKEFDLVHFTYSFGFPEVKNSVSTIHDVIPLYYDKSAVTKRYFKRYTDKTLKTSRAIIVPTEAVKRNILKFYKDYDESKIHVIHEAAKPIFRITDNEFDLYDKFNLPRNKFFLYVGRYEERKNIESIIEAYGELSNTIREEIKLFLVANETPKRTKKLTAKIEETDKKNIYHLKEMSEEELVKLYNNCESFIMPSYFEGFGLPIVEAMQCGAPVITSNTSCMPEIAGGAALLVDPKNVVEIKDAMLDIAKNNKLREELVNKSIKRAKDFSWEKAAKETVEVYKKYS